LVIYGSWGYVEHFITGFTTFASGLIQAVHAKTAGSHVALRGNFSGPVSATDPVKSLKD